MLFDTSPTEDPDSAPKKKGRKKTKPADAAPEAAQPIGDYLAAVLAKVPVTLGRLDGIVECHRCAGAVMDIVEEDGREWLIDCGYCGLKQWIPSIPGHLTPRGEGFVFADGRFSGKTVEEAYLLPNGRDYVEWAAKEHKRPSVRAACEKFLLTTAKAID